MAQDINFQTLYLFHARITLQSTISQDHNTSHFWLKFQLFRPWLGIWNDLQRGTFFTHIKTQSCSPEPEEYKYKHHLKFLRPDELNSKNKWLVKSGSEPCAHSSTNGFFIWCEGFVSSSASVTWKFEYSINLRWQKFLEMFLSCDGAENRWALVL